MTTRAARAAAPTRPLTAAEILAAQHPALDQNLAAARALDDAANQYPKVGRSVWHASYKELANVVLRLLNLDIGMVMVEGWTKVGDLREAGRHTLGTGERAVVELAGKTLTLTQHPRVQVVLYDSVIKELIFDVRVDVEVVELAGVVANGRLVQLTSGTCTATVSLGLVGVEVARARQDFNPGYVVPLGNGINLVNGQSR
jgi:hypothetical protein